MLRAGGPPCSARRTLSAVAGKKPMEAMRCLKCRISDAVYVSCSPTHNAPPVRRSGRAREGTGGRLKNPARSTCPRTSTLRISHFPDPHPRRYRLPRPLRSPARARLPSSPADTQEPSRWSAPPDERP